MNRLRPPEWIALAATPVLPWLGALPGGAWAVPLLAPLTVWRPFRRAVRAEKAGLAFAVGLLWAFLLSGGTVLLVESAPPTARRAVVNGETYRVEMFKWIQSGEGRESDLRSFVPVHAAHLVTFLLLAAVSGGYLGLALGAYLVGYMSYFVGAFAAASGEPLLGALVAWVPWSVIRVLAFVLLGVVAARPMLLRRRWPFARKEMILASVAALGLSADILLKATLAPAYARFLRTWLSVTGS